MTDTIANNNLQTSRDGFGQGLVEVAAKNERIVVVNADLTDSNRVADFAKKFPNRFIQVGVAEQNMAGIATGLALAGKIPIITSFAIFSPGLNWLQIRQACLSGLNIKVVSTHAGFSNGPDGASHQALEDIALMRVLPGMNVIVAADAEQARQATHEIINHPNSCYLRLSKTKQPSHSFPEPIIIGQAQVIEDGRDCTIITNGDMFTQSLQAMKIIKQAGYSVGLANFHTIKPLDTIVLANIAASTQQIFTIEEHQIAGGLGSTVAEFLSATNPIKITRIGIDNHFGQTGQTEQLWKEYGLDSDSIAKTIIKSLSMVKGVKTNK